MRSRVLVRLWSRIARALPKCSTFRREGLDQFPLPSRAERAVAVEGREHVVMAEVL